MNFVMQAPYSLEKSELALDILLKLIQRNKIICADMFYLSLEKAGFDELERVRFSGASMRKSASMGWTQKTDKAVNSKRNSSNLQRIWISHKYGFDSQKNPIALKELEAEKKHWGQLGYNILNTEA